ncbi:nitroreductase family deazaflavin-dependent oxidoreductase [Nocardioides sp.]|uniref:nitroreductase family deazaflavin-dependent oxidoreductase n=1 Tax=Nocardioides sp. TaxID=35761 RepID=UPI003565EC87
MGIAADLGYVVPRANAFQRAVQRFGSTAAGARLFAHTLPAMDRAVGRLSKGRTTVPQLLAGLPVLVLTTTGRRSGQPRDAHLIGIPVGDTLALLGTNFGQARTPAWVFNLEADPRATVTHHHTSVEVVTRPATPAEREQVMESSRQVYGGYLKYQERITGRELRIFLLTER